MKYEKKMNFFIKEITKRSHEFSHILSRYIDLRSLKGIQGVSYSKAQKTPNLSILGEYNLYVIQMMFIHK